MVIGHGMVAKRFSSFDENNDILIFASGVSNSKNTNTGDYHRETHMLKEAIASHPNKHLVYFSTCSVYDPGEKDSAYVHHKLAIEQLIRLSAPRFNIFRVSNLVGKSQNPNTILNYFYYHLVKGINFDLWLYSSRNLLDIDDMFAITEKILTENLFINDVVNIANARSYNVQDIIVQMQRELGTEANYIPIEKGYSFSIDISVAEPIIEQLNISFDEMYLQRLIKKYYVNP